MTARAVVELILPGLLTPWPQAGQPGFPMPDAPSLTRLLSRARVEAGGVGEAQTLLADRFGLPLRGLPLAPLAALGDGLAVNESEWWLRIEPVYLRPDRDRVLLFGVELDAGESVQLRELVESHFADDGLELLEPKPGGWYLRLHEDPGAVFSPPASIPGADIADHLPQGEQGRRWRSWLNEVQMLLHECELNRRREMRGLVPVTGLWPWGAGRLPAISGSPTTRLIGGGSLAKGLASRAGIGYEELPVDAEPCLGSTRDHALVVIDDPGWPRWQGDPFAWSNAVEDWEHRWFSPLEKALRAGVIDAFVFHAGNGRSYRIGRGGMRKFWRARRALTGFL